MAIVGLTVLNSTFVILLGINANVGQTFLNPPPSPIRETLAEILIKLNFHIEFQVTIEEIENTVAYLNANLTNKQKRYIHLKSLTNFVFHFRNLPNAALQENVLKLLADYVKEVTEYNASFTSGGSYALVTRHLNRLSNIYSSHLQFKSVLSFRFVVLFSIIGDGIFYLVLRNQVAFFFPVITASLLTYYVTRKILFGSKKKLFGPFY